jgi:hypothetical protein
MKEKINEKMNIALVSALANLAKVESLIGMPFSD